MYEATLLAILISVLLWRCMPPLTAPQLITPEGFIMPEPEDEPKEWEASVCFKKGGVDAPDPDPGIEDAANMLGQIGQEAMDFYKMAYEEGTARQEGIDEATKYVVGNMLEMSDAAKQRSEQLWGRYVNKYMPVSDKLISDAMSLDSAANQAAAAAEAKADVSTATAQQQAATSRQQQAMGVDPTSGRYQAIETQADTQAALNAANAQNMARTQKQEEAVKMRSGVSQLGMQEAGLAGQQAGQAGQLATSAIGTALGANQSFYQNVGLMGTGYGLGMQGYTSKGNMLLNQYQAELAAAQMENASNAANTAGAAAGLGKLIGGGLAFFSSGDVKKDKNPWMAYSVR
ncbi:hypothetical protein [Buttiauxella sp. S19-1]|uniref:hypothetical protein n=1 Tax=Buttiauxella sp. S19-1 TaxID=941430 RepID=UPI001EDA30E2|nr:hypothetical protein [Buttiauxella sp. S19-1]